MKIYVASSWRNANQPGCVRMLQEMGHEVFDFRNPPVGGMEREGDRGTGTGFQWSEIDPNWRGWTIDEYRFGLINPIAQRGYRNDKDALDWCDVCVLLMPCGRSAHLELGYAIGAGKRTIIVLTEAEPELMYLLVDYILTMPELRGCIEFLDGEFKKALPGRGAAEGVPSTDDSWADDPSKRV